MYIYSAGSVTPMKMSMMVVENEANCPFHTPLVVWEREKGEREKEKYNIICFFLAR
jgi:hypothetical protein